MRRKYAFIGIVLVKSAVVFVVLHGSQAETLRVVGFNVESGHADPAVVEDIAARLQDVNTCGFSGVQQAIREQMCGQKHEAVVEDLLRDLFDKQAYPHPSMLARKG